MRKRLDEVRRSADRREEEYLQKYEKFLKEREEEYDVCN